MRHITNAQMGHDGAHKIEDEASGIEKNSLAASGVRSWALPRHLSCFLDMEHQARDQFFTSFRLMLGQIVLFARVVLEVIEPQRLERMILQDLPIATSISIVILRLTAGAAIAAHPEQIARRNFMFAVRH